jgi:TPR repeat protein
MVTLAKAYSDGLGTDRDPGQEVMWLQKAADLGSVAAQEKLLWGFRFGNGIRMHDAVVSALRLWAGGSGSVDSSEVGDVISTAFRQGSGPDAVAQAVMDGLRAGPAALDDSGLAYVQKNTPRELWLSIEARLLASGHYEGEVSGFFRPDARAALAAWVAEAGPLPRN